MAWLELKVVDVDGKVKAVADDEQEVSLVYDREYEEGDSIVFTNSHPESFYMICVDNAIGDALVYIADTEYKYEIPFGEKKVCYAADAFAGGLHCISAREAYPWEINIYRNMSVNPIDQHRDSGCFPHAFANVETRGESVFAARNAIDGYHAASGHGTWPYGSWGINRREDAEIVIAFGREIIVDRIIIYLRADFPHDSWWTKATVEFSDETEITINLSQTHHGQEFIITPEKQVSWIKLKNLIKADDESPFPALTQLEVYGREMA